MQPRIHRDLKYALVRAWGTVVQRDLQVAAVIADIYAGRPVGYTTFLAYDEVAHHSGVERADALSVLRQVDRQIGRIAKAAKLAPRPYEFVVLSDHGQSQGATFRQRYEMSLEELVTQACAARATWRRRRRETTRRSGCWPPRSPRRPAAREPLRAWSTGRSAAAGSTALSSSVRTRTHRRSRSRPTACPSCP